MDVGAKGEVIALDVARDDQDLLVVTENGFGKRTRIDQYRKTSRGAKGVKTIGLTQTKGGLAGALVVRPHQELVFISQDGMVQRTGVRGISQQGRAATGVRVMNVREEDRVSAVALVVESDGGTAAQVTDADVALGPVELSADSGEIEGPITDGGAASAVASDDADLDSTDEDTTELDEDPTDLGDAGVNGDGSNGAGPDDPTL
jgi:DNA gyrase subunit A